MDYEQLSHLEKEQCKIEIELKRNYFGAFVTNVLSADQTKKVNECEKRIRNKISHS